MTTGTRLRATVISSLMDLQPNARRRCSLSHPSPAAVIPAGIHKSLREPPSYGLAAYPRLQVPGPGSIWNDLGKESGHCIGG